MTWHVLGNETPRQSKVAHFRAWLVLGTDPVIALVGPAYIRFSLCCIQCHEVQHMRDIPPRVSEEQLSWVQETPYPHNSVNLPMHLLHGTLHLLLGGDGLCNLYVHYTAMVTTVPFARFHLNNEISLIIVTPSYHKLLLSMPNDKQFHNVQRHISI